ncbi:hypothetical protein J6590_101178, partial [Homalodisca vitripennis]
LYAENTGVHLLGNKFNPEDYGVRTHGTADSTIPIHRLFEVGMRGPHSYYFFHGPRPQQ